MRKIKIMKIILVGVMIQVALLFVGCRSGESSMGVRVDGKMYLIDSGVGRVSVGDRVEVRVYEDGSGVLVLRRMKD